MALATTTVPAITAATTSDSIRSRRLAAAPRCRFVGSVRSAIASVIRSNAIAMTTITVPARIASAGFEKRPEFTTAPSPPPPMSRDDHHREGEHDRLVEPRSSMRRDIGSCTFVSICRFVAPIDAAASTVFTGTRRMPSAVIRMHGGIA
jgi:hypothetical protein